MSLPFAGLRVLELGTVIAGPFAGSLFADLGAEVIKIEAPGQPDVLRQMGPKKNGVPLWWGVNARDKRCITLNLKEPEGKEIFKTLVAKSDVLLENYRPGVLNRLGLGWAELHAINPGLVMVSISGFGQTGPDAGRPGFGKIAEGLSGIVNMTGEPEERPLFVGYSLADTATGLFGVLGAALALYDRDANGAEGAQVDVALYEPLLRMLELQFFKDRLHRQGSNDPYGWGQRSAHFPMFRCLESAEANWLFAEFPDEEALVRLRGSAADQVALEDWARTLPTQLLREKLAEAGARVAPVHDGLSAAQDAYLQATGDVLIHEDAKVGRIAVPGRMATFQGDVRPAFRTPAPGEDTAAVLADIAAIGPHQFGDLRQRGIV